MKYKVLDEDWGLQDGEIDALEERERSKTRFLMSGAGPCTLKTGQKQTIIKVWTEAEVTAFEVIKFCIQKAVELPVVEVKDLNHTNTDLALNVVKNVENIPNDWRKKIPNKKKN